jgi:L-amino acid N-acyltransferase YncA
MIKMIKMITAKVEFFNFDIELGDTTSRGVYLVVAPRHEVADEHPWTTLALACAQKIRHEEGDKDVSENTVSCRLAEPTDEIDDQTLSELIENWTSRGYWEDEVFGHDIGHFVLTTHVIN